jgi:hypothetical protein
MTMTDNSKTSAYAKFVAEAEAAVAAMKDPELRRVAFEKILETLLEAGRAASGGSKPQSTPLKATPGSSGGGKRSASQARQGPKSYIEGLIDDGFFKEQRTIAEVKAELANRGHHILLTSLSGPLQKLTQERRLPRQKITANGKGSKTTYGYSNW